MDKKEYFMCWREDFEDHSGWFTEADLRLKAQCIRLLESEDHGEATIYQIVRGVDMTGDFK